MDATRNYISIHNQIPNVKVEYIANQMTFWNTSTVKENNLLNKISSNEKWKKNQILPFPRKKS
jgi:hypothetical protein